MEAAIMPSSWKTALDGLDCTTLQEIASLCSIPREHIEDVYRCTPFQMGIAADSNKRDATYVQRFVLSLKAGLDIDRLCHAVREVIALNAALRTRIVDCDLGIVQVVLKDETSTDTQQTNLSLEQYLGLDRSRPMGLGMPLVRSAITKGGEKWVLTMHHSISDHTSALALIADVAQICQGQCPRPRAPFKDFVVHVNSIEESKARNFWAAQFTSSPSIFPEVAKSHTVDANNHINRKIRIPRQQVVLSLLPAYVECAWALTAHVYQRGDSVAYGTVYSGRPPSLGGLETTSGPTIATVPVQVAVDGSDSVEDMVRKRQQARRKIQASGAFLQFGMANIRKASDAARKAAEFQTLLNIRHTAESSSNSAMIRFDGEDDVHRAFALCLTCTIGDDEIVVDAEFDDIVMSSATIGRVLTQLEHILRTLAKAGPKSRVGDIVLLSAHDRLQTLRWNAAVAEPMEECLHDMVGRTVLAQPDEVAIDAWDGKMVYHELHAQSRRLAHTLRQRGVQRESMVPCLFERSLWSVVATLGVLIAGGVCVPLDPTHPRARHEAILSRTKSAVVLTSPALTRTAAGLGPAVVVVSEEMMGEPPVATSDGGGDGGINQSRHQDLAPAATPGNAAYIIFTSGSTGVPKGVVLEHRALATALTSIGPRVGWQRGLRLLQFTAQVWDASIAEIFGALLFGGCLCIPSNTSRESGLADYIRASSVDWVFQTPTGIRNLAPGDVPSVKTLVSGGERIPQDAASTWGSKLRFINGWGPCETSIFAAFAELSPASPYPETIGTPVGCAIWITDPENVNRLVPVGAVGELVVEGATVARGYLQDHGKTAAAFVDPPTWAPRRSSAMTLARRFYRTGDLGKYNADGSICFLGRQDHQIKLRGQRFEPGEVETVLETCVGVRNIVVTTHRAPSGRTEVVAVLTLSHPQLPGRATLEKHPHNLQELVSTLIGSISAHVRARVPAYMVPTAWIPVQEIPRAASNKIDRTTICEWLQGKDVAGESMLSAEVLADSSTSSPASPAEEILRAVWSSVLAMPEDEIGRECSFLHLGGDSIMAMQVATRCRKRGLQISVATLMRSTSLTGAAAECKEAHPSVPSVATNEATAAKAPLSPVQMLFTDDDGPAANNHFNQSWLLELTAHATASEMESALGKVVAAHNMLCARFSRENPEGAWEQCVCPGALADAWRFRTHLVTTDTEVDQLISGTQSSLNITSGPVFAVDLFNDPRQPERWCLFLVAHHLVCDLVSWRIIFEDLETTLKSPAESLQPAAPFIPWVNDQVDDDKAKCNLQLVRGKADLEFWNVQDRPPRRGDMVQMRFTLDEHSTTRLMGDACNKPFNTRPAELMLAAAALAFRKTFAERGNPALYTEGHGRGGSDHTAVDLSRTVGWFTTILPVFVDFDDRAPLDQAVIATKDSHRKSLENSQWFANQHAGPDPLRRADIELLFNFAANLRQAGGDETIRWRQPPGNVQIQNIASEVEQVGLLSVFAFIEDRRLCFWTEYSSQLAHQSRIAAWVKSMERHLVAIAEVLPMKATQFTFSDLPLLPLTTFDDLDRIHGRLRDMDMAVANVQSIYPCSAVQEGILFAQLKGNGGEYCDRFAFKITANPPQTVDRLLLAHAWQSVCKAHPILRTVFAPGLCDDTAFLQIVLHEVKPVIVEQEIGSHRDISDFLREYPKPKKTLRPTPPHRLALVNKPSDSAVYAVFDMDHTIIDAITMHLIVEQLSRAYKQGTQIPSGPDFSDYIALVQSRKDAAVRYWFSRLAHARPCLIPTEDIRVAAQPATLQVDVPFTDAERLHSFCKKHGLTVSSFMQVAWALVLRRYCNEATNQICFGCLHSGRDALPNAHEMLGPLLTMLVCRFDMNSPSVNAIELMAQAREDTTQGSEKVGCKLSEIHEHLDLRISPLFNTIMSIQHAWPKDLVHDGSGVKIELVKGDDPTEYPITVAVAYSKDEFLTRLSCHPGKLRSDLAAEIANYLAVVIENILSCPEQPLSSMDVVLLDEFQSPSTRPHQDMDKTKQAAAVQCELPPSCVEEIRPCSPFQDHCFRSSLSNPRGAMLQHVLTVNPEIRYDKLYRAWEIAESTFPFLRSRIVEVNDQLFQVVAKPLLTCREVDSVSEYTMWDSSVAARLGGPLFRLAGVRESNGEEHFVATIHRAVCNDHNLRMLSETLYSAYYGQPSLPKAAKAARLREPSARNVMPKEIRSYWQSHLLGSAEAPEFPPSPPHGSNLQPFMDRSRSLEVTLPRRKDDDWTSAVLQVSWALCVSRLTGHDQVTFGVTTEVNDGDAAVGSLNSGSGIAIVPYTMRTTLASTAETMLQHAQKCRSVMAKFALVDVKGIKSATLGEDVACEFHTVLSIQVDDRNSRSATAVDLLGSRTVPAASYLSTYGARLAITCLIQADNTIQMELAFDPRFLDAVRADVILHQYEHALLQLASGIDLRTPVCQLDPLSAYERTMMRKWGAVDLAATDSCIHEDIRQQAHDLPNRLAVSAWDGDLTYAELDRLSDCLGVQLLEYGVRADTYVPFFFEKSSAAVVTMLSVMKSGGAFAPMDINHPMRRVESILSDIEGPIILSSPAWRKKLGASKSTVVTIDMEYLRSLLHRPLDFPLPRVQPSDASYIVYTSGSTGEPKGIVVNHSSIATSSNTYRARLGLTDGTKTLQFVNFIFDVALGDIFMTLLSGGCLFLPSEAERADAIGIAKAINRTRSNFICLTPSLAMLLSPEDVPTLQTLALIGEPMQREIVERWADRVCLVNAYAPSEATIESSCAIVRPGCRNFMNVGAPNGCVYWIVQPSDHEKLVPLGCPGELLIQGPIVARGYLGKPEVTSAVFIDPPCWMKEFPGVGRQQRLYKTGDIFAQEPDESVIFVGRKDNQVKLRGQRIELGEVEYHLRRHLEQGSQLAVEVVRHGDGQRDPALMAFTAASRSASRADEVLLEAVPGQAHWLKEALTAALPSYMIPDIYVPLRRLPATSSGKTDRKALRAIGAGIPLAQLQRYHASGGGDKDGKQGLVTQAMGDPSVDGFTCNELALKRAWSEVLSIPVDAIGKDDDWFARGGNSVRSMRLIAAARKQGLGLTVPDIFRMPVLGELAAAAASVAATAGNGQGAPVEPTHKHLVRQVVQRTPGLREADIESVALATDAQAWMLAVGEVADDGFSNEIYVDCADGLDAARLRRACELVVARHATLRTAFVPVGDSLYQVVLGNIDTATDPATTSRSPRRELWRRRFAGFHLDRLSRHGSQCHRLRLNIHHALYDALYLDMIVQDVAAAYCNGPLAAGLHFHDWLTHQTAAPDAAAARRFWQATLRRSAMTWLAPPQGPCRLHTQSARVRRTVGRRALLLPSAAEASVLKAAWATVLAHAVGGDDVVFGQVTANRDSPTDQVLGPCVNILPVRAAIGVAASFRALVQQLDQQQRASIPHQHLGFRSIIRDCTAWPSWTRFSSLLVYQNHDAMILDDGSTHFEMGGASCRLSGLGRPADASDVWVIAQPGAADVDLELRYTPTVVSAAQAEWLAEALVRVLEQRVVRMDSPNLESYQTAGDDAANSCVPGDMNHVPQTNSPCVKDEARQTVSDAWRQVGLLPQDKSDDEDVSMFNCGGDVVTALLLSDFFRSRGHAVGVADIIRHPTRPMQNALLSTCS